MNIYFDTEFTGLTSEPRLISIGMVADNDMELYIELADGWTESQCSPWVRENVLPLLGRIEPQSRPEAAAKIASWVATVDPHAALIADSDWDVALLNMLLDDAYAKGQPRHPLKLVKFGSRVQAVLFESEKSTYFAENAAPQHHALIDAKAMRQACRRLFIDPAESDKP